MSDDQDGCKWVSVSSGTGLPGSTGPTAVKRLCVCVGHTFPLFDTTNFHTYPGKHGHLRGQNQFQHVTVSQSTFQTFMNNFRNNAADRHTPLVALYPFFSDNTKAFNNRVGSIKRVSTSSCEQD